MKAQEDRQKLAQVCAGSRDGNGDELVGGDEVIVRTNDFSPVAKTTAITAELLPECDQNAPTTLDEKNDHKRPALFEVEDEVGSERLVAISGGGHAMAICDTSAGNNLSSRTQPPAKKHKQIVISHLFDEEDDD